MKRLTGFSITHFTIGLCTTMLVLAMSVASGLAEQTNQPKQKEKKQNPDRIDTPLSDSKVGEWLKLNTRGMTSTWTVEKVDEQTVTVKIATELAGQKTETRLPLPRYGSKKQLQTLKKRRGYKESQQTLTIAGRKIKCKLVEFDMPDGSGHIKTWTSFEVPVTGSVKVTIVDSDGNESVISELIDFGLPKKQPSNSSG